MKYHALFVIFEKKQKSFKLSVAANYGLRYNKNLFFIPGSPDPTRKKCIKINGIKTVRPSVKLLNKQEVSSSDLN